MPAAGVGVAPGDGVTERSRSCAANTCIVGAGASRGAQRAAVETVCTPEPPPIRAENPPDSWLGFFTAFVPVM